jgi:mannonate dehydratase
MGSFHETADGSLDMAAIMQATVMPVTRGISARIMAARSGVKRASPGYGLSDRALGSVYPNGLGEDIRKAKEVT